MMETLDSSKLADAINKLIEHEDLINAINNHAVPRLYDFDVLRVAENSLEVAKESNEIAQKSNDIACGAIVITFIGIFVTAIITCRIYKKQKEILEKQTDIAEQQNKINLFEKRFEVYNVIRGMDSQFILDVILTLNRKIPIYKLITHKLILERRDSFNIIIQNACNEYNSYDNRHESLLESVMCFYNMQYNNIEGKISFLFTQEIEDECKYLIQDLMTVLDHTQSRVPDENFIPILHNSINCQSIFKRKILPVMESYMQIDKKEKRTIQEYKINGFITNLNHEE